MKHRIVRSAAHEWTVKIMPEYIEREVAIKAFCESCSDYVNNKCTYEGACEVNIIAAVPTVDV